jgi:hypothetical protein
MRVACVCTGAIFITGRALALGVLRIAYRSHTMAGMRSILRRTFLAVAVLAAGACGRASPHVASMSELMFLTREGCANTATLRARLDDALRTMRLPSDYQVIDVASLPNTDPRRAYPTPTLLYATRDVFGMPEPQPPYPDPT